MKVLMLSSDQKILDDGSESRRRMQKYAGLFELHLIIAGDKNMGDKQEKNLFLYPAFGTHFVRRIIGMFLKSKMLCQEVKFDLISSQGPDEIGLIGWRISKLFKIPHQLQIHTDVLSPWYRKASWKEWLRYKMALFLIPRADCLRVVSERVKKSIESKFRKQKLKIEVLPIFTEVDRFINAQADPEIEKKFGNYDFKMISAGRFMDKEKNFSMLIKAMKDFIKICPRALLVLVGGGSDEKNYRSQIKKYGLGKNIILEPWREDMPSFYKSFDLFLMPSNYEGWGRTVVEAMTSGLPIIMTDVGLANEFVKDGENAIITPVNDIKSFTEALINMYKNTSFRDEIKGNNLKFKWDINSEVYLDSYRNIMEKCLIKKP